MTMDPVTSQALEAAIEHWEENERAETPHDATCGASYCALCDLFLDDGCEGCPVEARTGNSCKGSPYHAAARAHGRWHAGGDRQVFITAARKEIDFLKSLRDTPEETS